MMTKVFRAVLEPLYIRIFFVIVPFLAEIPLIMTYTVPLQKIGLAWAALYLVYDLFTCRRMLKARYVTLIVPFIALMGLTVLLNYQTMLRSNVINWMYTVAVLLVLYPVDNSRSKEDRLREMSVLNGLLCVLTLCTAAVSLWMFITQYGGSVTYNGYAHPLGFNEGRLTGVFRNANYPTSVIGIFAGWMQLRINRTLNVSARKAKATFLWVSMALNFIFLCLTYSKGLLIGLMVGVFVVVFFDALRIGGRKEALRRHAVCRVGGAVLAAAVFLGVTYGAGLVTREVSAYIPPVYAVLMQEQGADGTDPNAPGIGDKVEGRPDVSDEYGPLTGRLQIWEQGLKYFAQKPLLGYGAYSLANGIQLENSTEQLNHFHNFYIHSLISTGILGTALLFAFLVLLLITCLRHAFQAQLQPEHPAFVVILAMLIFLLVINLLDVTILFMDKHSGYIFFIYFGYAMALVRPEKPWKGDAPARALDRLLPGGRA